MPGNRTPTELPDSQLAFLAGRLRTATAKQPDLADLRQVLLGIGGVELVAPPGDVDTNVPILLAEGRIMGGLTTFIEMQASNCHANVARLWVQRYRDMVGLCSGYALSDDGLWRQHSWGSDARWDRRNHRIETGLLRHIVLPRNVGSPCGNNFGLAERRSTGSSPDTHRDLIDSFEGLATEADPTFIPSTLRSTMSARARLRGNYSSEFIMANHYDATGTLVLHKVTPVITALFGDFLAEIPHPDHEGTRVLFLSSTASPSWRAIFENLKELARNLRLPLPAGGEDRIEDVLQLLAIHFNVADEPVLSTLIENVHHDNTADLVALFAIGTCFDDGHRLKAIKVEAPRRSGGPGAIEFSGDGLYISRPVSIHIDSSCAVTVGTYLHEAILNGNLDQGARHLGNDVLTLLMGVTSIINRRALQWRLAEYLMTNFLGGKART
jgi:hypothetical protein